MRWAHYVERVWEPVAELQSAASGSLPDSLTGSARVKAMSERSAIRDHIKTVRTALLLDEAKDG